VVALVPGHIDGRRHTGHRIQPGGVHLVVLAPVAQLLPGEQLGDAVPTPRLNWPSVSRLAVAAACAMIAGWIRVVGQVTDVVIGRLVTWEIAPNYRLSFSGRP
jgi:hypothetical protein